MTTPSPNFWKTRPGFRFSQPGVLCISDDPAAQALGALPWSCIPRNMWGRARMAEQATRDLEKEPV